MTGLEEKLQKLRMRVPEGTTVQNPKGTIMAFADVLHKYAGNRKNKHWNWATGIIYLARYTYKWSSLVEKLHTNILSMPPEKKYCYPVYDTCVATFANALWSMSESIDAKTLAFMKLFTAEMNDKDGNPDKLMTAYFGGGK